MHGPETSGTVSQSANYSSDRPLSPLPRARSANTRRNRQLCRLRLILLRRDENKGLSDRAKECRFSIDFMWELRRKQPSDFHAQVFHAQVKPVIRLVAALAALHFARRTALG